MLNLYVSLLPVMRGFLTNKAQVHLSRFEIFIQELARWELLVLREKAVHLHNSALFDSKDFKMEFYEVSYGNCSIYFYKRCLIEQI